MIEHVSALFYQGNQFFTGCTVVIVCGSFQFDLFFDNRLGFFACDLLPDDREFG